MMGHHLIKSWSSTQPVVALSPAEAELYALVKAAAQAKGLSSLLRDYGLNTAVTVYTNVTAAMGIVHRKGLCKMRHIETQYLWIQGSVNDETLMVNKIWTKETPADLCTKGLKREGSWMHISRPYKDTLQQPEHIQHFQSAQLA